MGKNVIFGGGIHQLTEVKGHSLVRKCGIAYPMPYRIILNPKTFLLKPLLIEGFQNFFYITKQLSKDFDQNTKGRSSFQCTVKGFGAMDTLVDFKNVCDDDFEIEFEILPTVDEANMTDARRKEIAESLESVEGQLEMTQ